MKIALDPYMHRHLSHEELPRKVAALGYEWIELSRDDFLAWWVNPRVYPERIASFKRSPKQHGVKIASLLPMHRWASPENPSSDPAAKCQRRLRPQLQCAPVVRAAPDASGRPPG